MRRESLPFYPLVAATLPVVSVFAANLAYVPAEQLVRPLLAVLLAAAALTLVLARLARSTAGGAAAATVVTGCLFIYGWFVGVADEFLESWRIPPIAAWAVGTAGLAAFAALRVRVVRPLNVFAGFVVAVAAANLGVQLALAHRLAIRGARDDAEATSKAGAKPDVFYIVLDGHGRSDAIRRAIGYDNSAFVRGLRARGFYVADQARSNYVQTELSLASSLNMDYVSRLLPNVDPKTVQRSPLAALIDDSELARRMRAKGYRSVAVTTGFPPVRFSRADVRLGSRWGGSMVETTLLQMTPFAQEWTRGSMYDARRRTLVDAFDNLGALGERTVQPRFVVAHILAPHPPFVFDAQGRATPRRGPFSYRDGDDFLAFVGDRADYRRGYAGQLAWVERQTLAAIDRILTEEGPGRRPVIVLQGDHGSKVGLAQNSLERTDLRECFPILNAYLVPEAARGALRSDITPVNSFRLILSALFGDDLPPLPNRSLYSPYAKPYDFTDVTDRIEER